MSAIYRTKSLLICLCLLALLTLSSCVGIEPPPPIDIRAKDVMLDQVDRGVSTYQEILLNLEKLAPSGSYKANLIKDIRAYIYARMALEKQDDEQYGFYLEESLRASEGHFAQMVFDEWLILQAKHQRKSVQSSDDFIRIVLLTIASKQLQSTLQNQGLLAGDSLRKRVVNLKGVDFSKDNTQIELPKPIAKGLSRNAREKYLSELCSLEQPKVDFYLDNLSSIEQIYGRAVVALCKNNHDAARQDLQAVVADRNTNRDPGLRYAAIKKLIQSYKATGDREMVSQLYKQLFEQAYPIEKAADDWGLNKFDALLRVLDDRLWAARNRALTGDYDEAELHAKFVVEQSKSAEQDRRSERSQIDALRNLRAEAYQALATRIEVERGNLDAAISYLALGNELQVKDKETAERFVWLLGLYYFMNEEFTDAKKYWNDLLARSKRDGTRARLYFWLARVSEKLGDAESMRFNLNLLADEYPLSFYNVVAVKESKLDSRDWSEPFTSLSPMLINLVDGERFDLTELRERESLSRVLLRAELSVAAKLGQELQQLLVRDLSAALQVERSQIDREIYAKAQVYVSRLQLAAGMYAHSFATTDTADDLFENFYKQWPDQLFVLYPRPYNDIMTKETRAHANLNSNIAFAIARQESSFNATVVSGAGAIGLLQLIPPTALRFAADFVGGIDAMAARLQNPEVNVQIGVSYLSFLSNHFGGFNNVAIAAAYNAGEFAVDAWVARRKLKDPLVWIEAIPFGETQGYVKNVWRNLVVYDYLQRMGSRIAWNFDKREAQCYGASCASF